MISWGLGSLDELETVEASEQPGESSRQEISDSGAIANDAMHSAAIEVLDSFDPAFLDSFDPLADPYPELWTSGPGSDDGNRPTTSSNLGST